MNTDKSIKKLLTPNVIESLSKPNMIDINKIPMDIKLSLLDCPFKEEWLSEEQHLKFLGYNKKMAENSKRGMKLYEKKSKPIKSDL